MLDIIFIAWFHKTLLNFIEFMQIFVGLFYFQEHNQVHLINFCVFPCLLLFTSTPLQFGGKYCNFFHLLVTRYFGSEWCTVICKVQ